MGKKDPFALGRVQRHQGRRGPPAEGSGRVREFFMKSRAVGRENCAPGGAGPTKEGEAKTERGGRDGDVRKLHGSLETLRYSSILQNHGMTNTN